MMGDQELRNQVENLRFLVEDLRVNAGMSIGGLTPSSAKSQAFGQDPDARSVERDAGGAGPAAKKTEMGMSQEQVAEFKKQQLLVNTLQNRIKELEAKMTEATSMILKEKDRITELAQEEEELGKSLYRTVDAINCNLSEKIALQRNEVKKLADDEPKPINYDPFNYGEAYGGDLVDFQARKRIIELKLLMNNLQSAMATMDSSIKVSPAIDLGYKVVRMDQLLHATGFDRGFQAGSVTREDGMLLNQSKQRAADRVDYPRNEAFQTDPSKESQWKITDTIMQTMYRLEMELAELQKKTGTSTTGNSQKTLEDIQETIKALKETKLDRDQLTELARGLPGKPGSVKNQLNDVEQQLDPSNYVNKDTFKENFQKVYSSLDTLVKRLGNMERQLPLEPISPAYTKSHGASNRACMSCDRKADPTCTQGRGSYGINLPNTPGFGVQIVRDNSRNPKRLKYQLARQYDIHVNSEVSKYTLPNPCFLKTRPRKAPMDVEQAAKQRKTGTDSFYIKGRDGKMYIGTSKQGCEKKSKNAQTAQADVETIFKSSGGSTPKKQQLMTGKMTPKGGSKRSSQQNEAATKIQAGFRGMQARASVDGMRRASLGEQGTTVPDNSTANCLVLEGRWSSQAYTPQHNSTTNCLVNEFDFYM